VPGNHEADREENQAARDPFGEKPTEVPCSLRDV
jgi:hypothetical protein